MMKKYENPGKSLKRWCSLLEISGLGILRVGGSLLLKPQKQDVTVSLEYLLVCFREGKNVQAI